MISEVFYVEDFIPNYLLNILISWAVEAPTKKHDYNDIAIEFLQLSGEDQNIAIAFAELNELPIPLTIASYANLTRSQRLSLSIA